MPSHNEKTLSKLALINILKKSKPEVRCRLINYLNPEGIRVLSEVVYNVLFNKLELSKSQKLRIKKEYQKEKKNLKEISKRRSSVKKRRKLLSQHGGGLGTILGKRLHVLKPLSSNSKHDFISGVAASLLSSLIFGHS